MHKQAKFNIGDVVIHKTQGYRAVIIDVDAIFQASGRYNPLAAQHKFATRQPWYRLLVDGSSQMTYVEEHRLIEDASHQSIHNPKIVLYLIKKNGQYVKNIQLN